MPLQRIGKMSLKTSRLNSGQAPDNVVAKKAVTPTG
jgi:hypothetical protein